MFNGPPSSAVGFHRQITSIPGLGPLTFELAAIFFQQGLDEGLLSLQSNDRFLQPRQLGTHQPKILHEELEEIGDDRKKDSDESSR